MTFVRTPQTRCAFIKEDGTRCNAIRMKSSPGGFCVGHSTYTIKEEVQPTEKNIVELIEDKDGVFRPLFEDAKGSLQSWSGWLSVLSGMFGLEMSEERLEKFKELTGRETSPTKQVKSAWIIASRRSGKSWLSSVVSVYLALFRKYPTLRKGERGWVCVVSPTRDMSKTIMGYTKAFLESIPSLHKQVEKYLKDEILFKNGTGIAVFTANSISVRSRTILGAILEESAFFPRDESAHPDVEVYASIVPATATIPNSLILGISSPYSRDGLLFSMWSEFYGVNSDEVLVVQSATRDLNPLISQEWIDSEMLRDPERNKAELMGLWRDDVSQFFDGELLNQSIDVNRGNLPPKEGVQYVSFVDGASGSSSRNADSFTCAVGHKEDNKCVIDGVWEWRPPFSPASVIKEISDILKSYRTHKTVGDKWAVGALSDLFKMEGIVYVDSKLTASDLYQESAVFFHNGSVRLPDNKRLLQQLRSLERHTRKSGKDQVTHPPGGHDDISNVACGVTCEILLHLVSMEERLAMMPQLSGSHQKSPWVVQEEVRDGKAKVIFDDYGRQHVLRDVHTGTANMKHRETT